MSRPLSTLVDVCAVSVVRHQAVPIFARTCESDVLVDANLLTVMFWVRRVTLVNRQTRSFVLLGSCRTLAALERLAAGHFIFRSNVSTVCALCTRIVLATVQV
ncbi:hypothetical protein NP493_1330g00001 [Ridgeia piscesae]|uniref:Uncharacterized protein n=1 Tax=Ridgeia piscesae TaxID=27915 RepID=A0AAD9K7Q3_RIDPI|nr:hypothetical protein NP493_1330g00001 [Ridgeia piscesae]